MKDLGPEIPWHLSAFFPSYKMLEAAPTDSETLLRAWRIGTNAGLRYVYCGNLPGLGHEDTICFRCGQLLIERTGFAVRRNRLEHGRCPYCQTPIEGVWENKTLEDGSPPTRVAKAI